jgi:hypothetical protein
MMRMVALVDFAAVTREENKPRNTAIVKSRNNASRPQWTAIRRDGGDWRKRVVRHDL